MAKTAYLEALRRAMTGLPPEAQAKTLAFYEQRFVDGVLAGRTEEDIERELDDPKKVAMTLRASIHLQSFDNRKNPATFLRMAFAFIGLLIFNLVMVLPAMVYPPMFNRYGAGQQFGAHVDNAVRLLPGSGRKIRTDVSATLFLAGPDEYEGGELLIEDTYGAHSVKLPAGHMIVYPSTSLHRVEPVRSGERIASFFWIQSMVRDDARRTLLFDMDSAIQHLSATGADADALVRLTGSYHNLLRMWADV